MRAILTKLLLVVALLLMPLAMAPAAAEVHHGRAAAAMADCDRHAPTHHPKSGLAECTMACSAALPASDVLRDEPPLIPALPVERAAAQIFDGLRPETATPPPRTA